MNEQNNQMNMGGLGNQQATQPMQGAMGNGQVNAPKKNNKKIIISIVAVAIVAVIVVAVFLLGSPKQLVCTRAEDMSGMAMTGEVTVNFGGNQIKDLEMNLTVELGSFASYKDTFVEEFEKQYESFEEDGIPVEVTSDDSNIYIKMTAERSDFTKVVGVSVGEYDELKEGLEADGWECK